MRAALLRWTAILIGSLALGCSGAPEPAAPMPPPPTRALVGGARLLVLELPDLDRLEGTVRFHAGSVHEPRDQVGLLEVLVDALYYGGPMQRSGAELQERLAERGAALTVQRGQEVFELDFTCAPDDLAWTLSEIAQLLVSPAYPPEFVARARERLIDRLEREAGDPAALADRVAADLAWGAGAPTSRRATFATAAALTREALLAWHRANLGPDRMWVGIAGPLRADEVAPVVERAFAELAPVGPAPPVAPAPYRQPDETGIALVVLPGCDRVETRFVAPGAGAGDPDFAALRLWSDAMAGDGDGDGAFFAPRGSGGGDLFGFASGKSFDLALLETLAPEGFPAARLERARERVLAAEAEVAASPRARLERQLDLAFHGRPSNFWELHRAELRTLDAAEVERAAARHLPRGGVVLVSVHPAPPDELPLPSFRVDARPDLRGTPEGVERARALLAAVGGRDAWSGLESLLVEGQVELEGGSEVAVRIWRDFVRERLRIEQTRGGETTAQVVTQDGAWSLAGDTLRQLPFEVDERAHYREERLLFRVLRDLALARTSARTGPGGSLEILRGGEPLCRIETGEDGLPLRVIVPGGPGESDLETELGGWRRVAARDGSMLALPSEMRQPLLARGFRWERFEVDVPLEPGLFRTGPE